MPNVSSEEQIQEDILAFLATTFPNYKIVEQAIPDSQTVVRTEGGAIPTYGAVQFGDLQQAGATSFVGPRGDDYVMPVYLQAVSSTARSARRFANKLRNAMLGASFEWSGEVRKRPGGGMFPIVSSSGATEAYQMPASFGVTLQYTTELT